MEYYYCKKCGDSFSTPSCHNCGISLKDTCYIGEKEIYPIKDSLKLFTVLKIALFSSLAFILILSVAELVLNGGDLNDWWIFLTRGGVFISTIQLFFAVIVIGLILLLFQGKEIQQYIVMDKTVIKKVWIKELRTKCWFRFLSYDANWVSVNEDNERFFLVSENVINFNDASRASFNRFERLLKIYHPFNFVFTYIYLAKEDVERVCSLTVVKRLLNKEKK